MGNSIYQSVFLQQRREFFSGWRKQNGTCWGVLILPSLLGDERKWVQASLPGVSPKPRCRIRPVKVAVTSTLIRKLLNHEVARCQSTPLCSSKAGALREAFPFTWLSSESKSRVSTSNQRFINHTQNSTANHTQEMWFYLFNLSTLKETWSGCRARESPGSLTKLLVGEELSAEQGHSFIRRRADSLASPIISSPRGHPFLTV